MIYLTKALKPTRKKSPGAVGVDDEVDKSSVQLGSSGAQLHCLGPSS